MNIVIIILMGVAGAGKSTVGTLLARELQWIFYEGDDFHPAANVRKMKEGIVLTDNDRKPWLAALRKHLTVLLKNKENAILACSALKESYRTVLSVNEEVRFVYLKGDRKLFERRVNTRQGHFFNPLLLDSQLEILEEPQQAVVVDSALSPADILEKIKERLSFKPSKKQ